ncbi:hypothetical protein FC19_GL000762 [Liquorilactobacillus aquaticus DSM 21051]|uniref:Uncharacterized protein n=1 Tax=Liquorilactobacillus aquaticus DSM 21051 TaxID=1423725 RepID=A0A0R2D3F0_9LACO|nr:hypothetical protein FC19_GL000762 [Liquorilactobacillus aquaticus DSM 21051]
MTDDLCKQGKNYRYIKKCRAYDFETRHFFVKNDGEKSGATEFLKVHVFAKFNMVRNCITA